MWPSFWFHMLLLPLCTFSQYKALSGIFDLFFLLLYPTRQCYELWVISLGKVCRAAGSWWAAIKCSNWAFNHADILTALNLSWECASESVTVGLWLDHQDAIPDHSEAEWDEAVNRCWWGEINQPVQPRDSSGPPDDTGATETMFLHRDIFMTVCWWWVNSNHPSKAKWCLAPVRKCWSLSQQPLGDRQEYPLSWSKVTSLYCLTRQMVKQY